MKLKELISEGAASPVQFKKIERWLKKHKIYGYISTDGTIDVNGNVQIGGRGLRSLPYQFGHVVGQFDCSANRLTSLKGAPKTVGKMFSCAENLLTSLEGAPREIGGMFYCSNNTPSVLHNIHKYVKVLFRGHIEIGANVDSRILGLLYIKNLQVVSINTFGLLGHMSKGSDDLVAAVGIVNKHLKGDRNIHTCQEELIEAGLSRFARL